MVGPAHPPTPPNPWLLQLTGAERRLLQEGGVPELSVERIDLLLECLEDHQAADHGPEARWALARLVRRTEDALDSLQVIMEVLARRLQLRGYLPVTRIPRPRDEQVRLLDWIRRSSSFVQETLDHHLRTPLQPDEAATSSNDPISYIGLNSSTVQTGDELEDEQVELHPGEAATSSSSSPAATARSRSRSPSRHDSELRRALDDFGMEICLLPSGQTIAQYSGVEGTSMSFTPSMQRALDGELLGVWREPSEMTDVILTSTSTTSTMGYDGDAAGDDGVQFMQLPGLAWSPSSSSSSSPSPSSTTTTTWMFGECASSSTTTPTWTWMYIGTNRMSCWTSTTTSTSRSALEAVANSTADLMVYANTGDVVDAAHRLLARARALVRNQRLLLEALEEVLLWLPTPPEATVLNGPTLDVEIWAQVARQAGHADGLARPEGGPSGSGTPRAVLLQPGLARDLEGVAEAFPDLSPRQTAGLRRRLWRRDVAALHVEAEGRAPVPLSSADPLFLVQTDESEAVPEEAAEGPPRRVPAGRGVHDRRRQRQPRRVSLFADIPSSRGDNGALDEVSSTGLSHSSVLPAPPASSSFPGSSSEPRDSGSIVANREHAARERSRSRDV